MEYLLKLRCSMSDLEKEITTGMEQEYQMKVTVIREPGSVRVPMLDTNVLGFNVRDDSTKNCTTYVAIGYEHQAGNKYRVYGSMDQYCPTCNISFSEAGKFCKYCGTKIVHRI